MKTAMMMKMEALTVLDAYCTKNIEPLFRTGNTSVTFGEFNENGKALTFNEGSYTSAPHYTITDAPSSTDIINFLRQLGYTCERNVCYRHYDAVKSGTKKTTYFKEGSLKYYTIKISV